MEVKPFKKARDAAAKCCFLRDLPVNDEFISYRTRARMALQKVLNEGVHHRNGESMRDFRRFPFFEKEAFGVWSL